MAQTFDREVVVAAYLDALDGVREVASRLTEAQWALPTDLEGWSVQDNVAHVCAIEDELAGRPVPGMAVDWSLRPHVRTPFQQYTEVGVEHRRSWTPAEVLAELDRLVVERRAMLELLPDDPDAEMRGPAGLVGTVSRVTGIRTFDVWAHEQDIRRAVGWPPRLDCPAAAVAVERIAAALPILLAREAQAPPGTLLRWELGASVRRTVCAAVGEGGRGELVDGGEPDVVIRCDTETLILLACGRRAASDLDIAVEGDIALGKRVIDAMPITP